MSYTNTTKYINVDNNSTLHAGYYPLPASAVPGQVFFDSSSADFKVFDGVHWTVIGTPNSINAIEMTHDAEIAIDWAIEVMHDYKHLTELADKYPMVRDALTQLEVVIKLHQNLDNGTEQK